HLPGLHHSLHRPTLAPSPPQRGRLVMSRTVETAGIGLAQASVDPRSFALYGDSSTPRVRWFTDGLRRLMIERGYHEHDEPGPEVQVVLNRIDPERPRPYRRKSAPTFVVAL